MYQPDKYSQYSSPYAGGNYGEESTGDKLRYFFEDHGKKVIAIIILLAIGVFAWDFFIGSYKNVTLEIVDTEGQYITGDLSITKVGENNPTYEGPPTTIPLRADSYVADITATGYRFRENVSFTVSEEGQTESFKMEKALVTEIREIVFPQQLFLGQTTSGSVNLYNSGRQDEEIELVFEDDFKGLIREGFSITTSPSNVIVPAGGTVMVSLEIIVPSGLDLKDSREGDSQEGNVRIKFTDSRDAQKEIAFMLLPEAEIQVKPNRIEEKLDAGETLAKLDTITIQNKGKVNAQNISLSVEVDSTAPQGAVAWFSFDTDEISQLNAGERQDIELYITTPLSPAQVIIAGASHVVVEGETWRQTIPLNITIEPVATLLTAELKTGREVKVGKEDSENYETITDKKVEIQNNGDTPISRVEVLSYTPTCHNWISIPNPNVYDLSPGQKVPVPIQITAPYGTDIDKIRTCEFKVQYDDPLTGELVEQATYPPSVILRTED